jgi:hypothetical protein
MIDLLPIVQTQHAHFDGVDRKVFRKGVGSARQARFDALIENSIFYIFSLYEFSRSLDHVLKGSSLANHARFSLR